MMKTRESPVSSPVKGGGEAGGWEMRPGGMLVQQRLIDAHQNLGVVPNIKVRVKYGSSYHQISISSQASFGELKKLLVGPTGLRPQDQKLMYKDKERDSKHFLDHAGVKNGSKLVLIEDELSKERWFLEARKTAKMEKASKDIAAIRSDVEQLAKQVSGVEMEISGGKKVMEIVISNMIEMLMSQLIKLDAIDAEGDVKLQRRMQVKRVQKLIEHLDMLKIRNSTVGKGHQTVQAQHHHRILSEERQMPIQNHQGNTTQRHANPLVVTTNWETF